RRGAAMMEPTLNDWRTRAERAEALIRAATTALDPSAESLTAALLSVAARQQAWAAERRALLVVALHAYELSQHVAGFDRIADPRPIMRLNETLAYAFGTQGWAEIGQRIAAALGGYEAAQVKRRAAQGGGEP